MIKLDIYKQIDPRGPTPCIDLNLEIGRGSRLGLTGASGSGKTTFLKMLAGLVSPDSGEITFEDEIWFSSSKKINCSPQRRNTGFVFQDYALFPNMSVRRNLEFAFRKKPIQPLLNNVMEMLDIGDIAEQMPITLSGGQKQRVALGRALISQPRLLLMDEPLSALDPEMRSKLQKYLHRISQNFEGTIILISHDPYEISRLADRVIELERGRITRSGDPEKLLNSTVSGYSLLPGAELVDVLTDEQVIVIKINGELVKIPFPSNSTCSRKMPSLSLYFTISL